MPVFARWLPMHQEAATPAPQELPQRQCQETSFDS
jgi:hypothetical protein